jgi:hypothetical protein
MPIFLTRPHWRHCAFSICRRVACDPGRRHRIKHLEAALGCKLFCRLPREIKRIEQGQRFAAAVEAADRPSCCTLQQNEPARAGDSEDTEWM